MSSNGRIPFLDLVTPHKDLEEELVAVFRSALRSADFVGGQRVQEFEGDFAKFCETEHSVAVGSGTDALRFALLAAGLQPGETVVTVPNTFIATTEAISQAGGRPDFVDVDERTYNMDAQKLHKYCETQCALDRQTKQLLNKKTGSPVKGIVPVHLYGQMADMDPILEVAERYNLFVIEDACQAHGSSYYSARQNRWRSAGAMGVAAAFSFYPGKNLGACGEAGAVTTNDPVVAAKVRMLRDHGQTQKYRHEIEGYNGRMDAIQAGLLNIKLKHLPEWNEQRRQRARFYGELLKSHNDAVIAPCESPRSKSVYHLYVIRVESRDQLQSHLAQAGIGTQIHYPVPLHLQQAYAALGYKRGDFPVAEKAASQILSLPMYPQLQPSQQESIVQEVINYLAAESVTGVNERLGEASADTFAA